MPDRHRAAVTALPADRARFAIARRKAFAAGYHARGLRREILVGLVVGVVTLPQSLALTVASGVPPQRGLLMAILEGGPIAQLVGSAIQVFGPTAPATHLLNVSEPCASA